MKQTKSWVDLKNSIKHDETLIFVGEMGVSGVIDGKLPNGEVYEWSKKNRRKLKKPRK